MWSYRAVPHRDTRSLPVCMSACAPSMSTVHKTCTCGACVRCVRTSCCPPCTPAPTHALSTANRTAIKIDMQIIIGWGRLFSRCSLGPQCARLHCTHSRQCRWRMVRIHEKKINPAQMPLAMLHGWVGWGGGWRVRNQGGGGEGER